MTNEDLIIKYLPKEVHKEALKKLENGEPVQYIIGSTDFYGYDILVDENVLIPRFETETLVEKLIIYINKYFDKKVSIADLGTGSGAISIALNKEIDSTNIAFDVSLGALELAKKNAKKNEAIVEFKEFDIRNKIEGVYDVIVSNPPYIDREDEVEDKVKNFEPHLALYANNNGLEFYEKILSYAKEVLNKKSIIAFEIGMTQGNYLKELSTKYFNNAIITVEKDLTNKDRYIFIINE